MVSGHIYVTYILLQLKKMDTVGKAQTDTKCRQMLGFQSTRLLRDRGPEMDADCTWPCTPSRSRRCQEWLWLNQRTSTSNDLMNKYILMCLLSKIWSCILLHPKMQNAPSSELQGPKPPHWGGTRSLGKRADTVTAARGGSECSGHWIPTSWWFPHDQTAKKYWLISDENFLWV